MASEEVAVRAETHADELEQVSLDAVDQHEIRLDMAIAESGVLAGKGMVAERGWQWSLGTEQIDDVGYLSKTFPTTDSKL